MDNFTFAASAVNHSDIIAAAARNNIPVVYSLSAARDGGLLSYGVDQLDTLRRIASYVDRILRGEKPANLSVQLQAKFEMVIDGGDKTERLGGPPARQRADRISADKARTVAWSG